VAQRLSNLVNGMFRTLIAFVAMMVFSDTLALVNQLMLCWAQHGPAILQS
jgi:hypothetical protein